MEFCTILARCSWLVVARVIDEVFMFLGFGCVGTGTPYFYYTLTGYKFVSGLINYTFYLSIGFFFWNIVYN